MSGRRLARIARWFVFLAVQSLAAIVSGRSRLFAQADVPPTRAASSVAVSIATRRLPRGTVLTERDITVARVAHGGTAVSGPTDAAAGWITRRVVHAGEALRPPAVGPAPLVRAGQTVEFTYMQGGLRLTLHGVALAAAALGDVVEVRLGAKRRVTGIVSGPARITATDSTRSS
ncbi:MAG: flagellar basal body P-ring formation chaperone FlgA [Gemmatimonadaceae bacterium]|nr:flagellar basal body P-ring formation chaperone FlgA [Gemmatimonadaceae bacterium]